MNKIDQTKLIEMLRLARASLNEEFMQRQTEAYQKWHASCNEAWKTNGMLLPPYSIKLVYPSEQDIVKRALEIYNTLTPALETTVQQEVPSTMSEEVFVEPVATTPEVVQTVDEPVVEKVETEIVEEPTVENKFKSLLTKWGGRGSFKE